MKTTAFTVRLIVFFLLSATSFVTHATCNSRDQRSPFEQLSCFCPQGPFYKELQNLGPVGGAFGLPERASCQHQVNLLFALLDSQISDADRSQFTTRVSQKLSQLGVSDSTKIVAKAQLFAPDKNSISLGGSRSVTRWTFRFENGQMTYKYEFSSSGPVFPGMRAAVGNEAEFAAVMTDLLNPTNLFSDLEAAAALKAKLPEDRVNACWNFTKQSSRLKKCLTSPDLSTPRIDFCASMRIKSEEQQDGCLNSNLVDAAIGACVAGFQNDDFNLKACLGLRSATADLISACVSLTSDGYTQRECLNANPPPERVRSCKGGSNRSSYHLLECVKSRASAGLAEACGKAHVSDYHFSECTKSNADVALVAACASAKVSDYHFLECVKSRAEVALAQECATASLSDHYFLECVKSRKPVASVQSCKAKKLSDYDFNSCL